MKFLLLFITMVFFVLNCDKSSPTESNKTSWPGVGSWFSYQYDGDSTDFYQYSYIFNSDLSFSRSYTYGVDSSLHSDFGTYEITGSTFEGAYISYINDVSSGSAILKFDFTISGDTMNVLEKEFSNSSYVLIKSN